MAFDFGKLNNTYSDLRNSKSSFENLVTGLKTLRNDFSSVKTTLEREKQFTNTIHRFKNKVKDVSRNNLFLFDIPKLPNSLDNGEFLSKIGVELDFLKRDYFSLLCTSAPIPQKTINVTKIRYSGLQVPFPASMDYDSIVVKFIVDKDCTIVKFFDSWMSLISGRSGNILSGLSYYDDIKTDLYIYKVDRVGNKNYLSILEGAFPIGMSALDNSTDSEGINTIDVTFTFIGEKINYNPDDLLSKIEETYNNINSRINNGNNLINDFKTNTIKVRRL